LYADLYEVDEGIDFYYKHYREEDEVKLYILIEILFELRDKENVVKELEKAIKTGVKLRSRLVDLLNKTKSDGMLPEYMW
jgi:hypothetical protein